MLIVSTKQQMRCRGVWDIEGRSGEDVFMCI